MRVACHQPPQWPPEWRWPTHSNPQRWLPAQRKSNKNRHHATSMVGEVGRTLTISKLVPGASMEKHRTCEVSYSTPWSFLHNLEVFAVRCQQPHAYFYPQWHYKPQVPTNLPASTTVVCGHSPCSADITHIPAPGRTAGDRVSHPAKWSPWALP